MNKAVQYQRLSPWKKGVPSVEEGPHLSDQTFISEEDNVNWPPVIARIRDFDLPVAPKIAPPAPIAEVPTPATTIRTKLSERRLRNRRFSSQLIALAGLFIFILALMPFMHLRESKSTNDVATTNYATPSTAPKTGYTPAWNSGTAVTVQPNAKTPEGLLPASPVAPSSTVNPVTNIASGAPPLLSPPEKKDSSDRLLANPLPPNRVNSAIGSPAEQIATQTMISRAGNLTLPNTAEIPRSTIQPNPKTDQVVDQGESVPWQYPNSAKTNPMNTDNGMLLAAPEMTNISPRPAPANWNVPPAIPNQMGASGFNAPTGRAGSLQAQGNATAPNNAIPMTNDSVYGNREFYQQADARSDYRRQYDFTPDYRKNPEGLGTNPQSNAQPYPSPYGQNVPAYGQYPLPNGQNFAPAQYQQPYGQNQPQNGGGRTALPPAQQQQQYNQNPYATPVNPANRPVTANIPPNRAAGAWQNQNGGSYLPPSTNNYNPNVGNRGTGNPGASAPGVANPDGYYHYPATENPPARNPI